MTNGFPYLAVALTTLHCVKSQMSSSVGSCSPVNSMGSPEYVCEGMDYDSYVQYLVGVDPYTSGYAPPVPVDSLVPDSSPIPDVPTNFSDEVQASFGFYPFEVLEGSNSLEFIIHYPYPWDPSPPEIWDEWSMRKVTCRFLDHITWFEGEWHLVWGEYTGPVYRMIK